MLLWFRSSRSNYIMVPDSVAMLLPNAVELHERSLNGDSPEGYSASPTIDVISSQWKDRVLFIGLLLAMVVPSLTVVVVLTSTWIESPSQRGWLVIGFSFYIVTALKALWEIFLQVYEQMF